MRLLPNGDIRVQHLPASTIIGIAHQLDSYRVVNVPAWTTATYYDILARANADTTRENTFAMMRAMLVERFALVAHRETRPIQGFAIVRGSNLIGTFDVDLRWSKDATPTDDTPVMPTALQEQLGLRLQREQVPTEVLVVDHVERPSQN